MGHDQGDVQIVGGRRSQASEPAAPRGLGIGGMALASWAGKSPAAFAGPVSGTVRHEAQEMTEAMELPETLYKYRRFCPRHLSMLSNNEVFFAAPGSLNDPRDCRLPLRYDAGTRAQIYKKALETLKYISPGMNRDQRKKEAGRQAASVWANRHDSSRITEFRRDIEKHMDTAVGVLSLSAVWGSPVMWTHYADGHTGFCVAFDRTALVKFIHGLESRSILIRLEEVLYPAEMPVLDPYVMTDEKLILAMIRTKSQEWSYEQEYRLLAADRPDFALNLPPNIISAVILGPQCSPANEEQIIHILRGRAAPTTLYRAEQQDTEYRMALREVAYA